MLLSDSGRWIFVHNPKTGGISMIEALRSAFPDARKTKLMHDWLMGPAKGKFTFCFIRNPYTRLVSAYEFFKQRPEAPWHKYVKGKTFKQFVMAGYNRAWFKPQVIFTKHCGFVGRYESLSRDWGYVQDVLKVDMPLPHNHNGNIMDHWSYYDRETKAVVDRVYADDFRKFKYKFDGDLK